MNDLIDDDVDRGDDDGFEVTDLAETLRDIALAAWNATVEAMKTADTVRDLPLVAAMEGPQAAGRMFAPEANPYVRIAAAGTPARYADTSLAGVDLVRMTAETPYGEITVVDTRSFTVFVAPIEVPLAGKILLHDGPLDFGEPDEDGWLSTRPEITVSEMEDWHTRIDALDGNRTRLYLLYKAFPSAQAFGPDVVWF